MQDPLSVLLASLLPQYALSLLIPSPLPFGITTPLTLGGAAGTEHSHKEAKMTSPLPPKPKPTVGRSHAARLDSGTVMNKCIQHES